MHFKPERKGSAMSNCVWCDKSEEITKNKSVLSRNDCRYMPSFIEDPNIGNNELRNSTNLRRWVHDLRWDGQGIVQCGNGDATDAFLTESFSQKG